MYIGLLRKDDWEKDAEDGVARKESTGKAKKEVYGCRGLWMWLKRTYG